VVLDNVTASSMTNSVMVTSSSTTSDLEAVVDQFGPSPDEMVIAARGRRALPLTFSPDVHSTPPRGVAGSYYRSMSKLARPSSFVSRLLLPTRKSPRKRLTLTDSPPELVNNSPPVIMMTMAADTPSPDLKMIKRSPISKKCKLEAEDDLLDTPTLLKGLSRDQLMIVLVDLMAKKPELEEDIRQVLPRPDLSQMEEKLNYLKRNIFKALPNTRLESKTDSLAYSRVSVHLLAFKKELADQGKRLIEAQAWPSLVDHAIMAWNYVLATPTWDNAPHNNLKKQCFKALAANLNLALKKGTWTANVCVGIKNK
jgi:hypothetical protein